MKKFTAIIGVLLASIGLSVAEEGKAVPASAVEKDAWLTSFDEAKAQAAKLNVPILADFSGSDWCGWCIKLDKEVFSQAPFKSFATKNLVLLMVDFPRRKPQGAAVKKQNDELAREFNIEGFPTVLLLDAKGKELARTGYQPGGAEAYVKHLQELISKK